MPETSIPDRRCFSYLPSVTGDAWAEGGPYFPPPALPIVGAGPEEINLERGGPRGRLPQTPVPTLPAPPAPVDISRWPSFPARKVPRVLRLRLFKWKRGEETSSVSTDASYLFFLVLRLWAEGGEAPEGRRAGVAAEGGGERGGTGAGRPTVAGGGRRRAEGGGRSRNRCRDAAALGESGWRSARTGWARALGRENGERRRRARAATAQPVWGLPSEAGATQDAGRRMAHQERPRRSRQTRHRLSFGGGP